MVCCRARLGPGFAVAKVRRCGAGAPLSRRRRRVRHRPSGTRSVRGGHCDPSSRRDGGVCHRRVFPMKRQLRAKEEQVVERRSQERSRRLKAGSRRALRVGVTAFSSLYPRIEDVAADAIIDVLRRASEAWVSAWFPDLRAHFGRSGLDGEIGQCRNHLSARDFSQIHPACSVDRSSLKL